MCIAYHLFLKNKMKLHLVFILGELLQLSKAPGSLKLGWRCVSIVCMSPRGDGGTQL